MKKWVHKTELGVDRIIPYALIVLLVIIAIEIFFVEYAEKYHLIIEVVDLLVIAVFVLDLYFKYIRIRSIPTFFRKYWLHIIAIFPFFLVFRIAEELVSVSYALRDFFLTSQKVVHEGVEAEKVGSKLVETISQEGRIVEGIEKEGMRLVKEAEALGKASRTEMLARFVRPIARALRFAKYGTSDTQEGVKKELKRDEKLARRELKKGEGFIKKEERLIKRDVHKLPKIVHSFVFYERATGKHHVHERR